MRTLTAMTALAFCAIFLNNADALSENFCADDRTKCDCNSHLLHIDNPSSQMWVIDQIDVHAGSIRTPDSNSIPAKTNRTFEFQASLIHGPSATVRLVSDTGAKVNIQFKQPLCAVQAGKVEMDSDNSELVEPTAKVDGSYIDQKPGESFFLIK